MIVHHTEYPEHLVYTMITPSLIMGDIASPASVRRVLYCKVCHGYYRRKCRCGKVLIQSSGGVL